MRTIAIGDIHGCSTAFAALLALLKPGSQDTLICLGDYVDRGPDSAAVLDRLVALEQEVQLIPLLGNHEEMLLDSRSMPEVDESWRMWGGRETLESYQKRGPVRGAGDLPAEHLAFLERCRTWHTTETHVFVHANALPDQPVEEQPLSILRWKHLARDHAPLACGRMLVCGHTAQRDARILDTGHLLCIDTYCYGGGWLTAWCLETDTFYQANQRGDLRSFRRLEGHQRGTVSTQLRR